MNGANSSDPDTVGELSCWPQDESRVILTRLTENLLVLDQAIHAADNPVNIQTNRDLFDAIVHDTCGLKCLSDKASSNDASVVLEKIDIVLNTARSNTSVLVPELSDAMFDAVEWLDSVIGEHQQSNSVNTEASVIVQRMEDLLHAAPVTDPARCDRTLVPSQTFETTTNSPAGESGVLAASDQPASERDDCPDPLAGIVDESEIPAKYLSIFIDEAAESLDEAAEYLDGTTLGCVDSLLIVCHRIKGSAASLGLHRPAKLAHLMEDQLQNLRDAGVQRFRPDIARHLLEAVDALRHYVEALSSGKPCNDNFTSAYRTLEQLSVSDQSSAKSAITPAPQINDPYLEPVSGIDAAIEPAFPEQDGAQSHCPPGTNGVVGRVIFADNIPLVHLKAKLVIAKLDRLGKRFFLSPPADAFTETLAIHTLVFGVATDLQTQDLRQRIDVDGVLDIQLVKVQGSPQDCVPTLSASPAAPSLDELESCEKKDFRPLDTPLGVSPSETVPAEQPESDGAIETSKETAPSEARKLLEQNSTMNSGELDSSATTPDDSGSIGLARDKPAETLRVDIDRLDQLMNLSGQLAISKARFGQVSDQLKSLVKSKQGVTSVANVSTTLAKIQAAAESSESDGESALAPTIQALLHHVRGDLDIVRDEIDKLAVVRSQVNALSEAVHQLDRVSQGIQKSVMDTRLVPIGPLFNRFKRVVRDISRANDREIKMEISGEKTELDKRMIDELSDPLIHMIRNAADHGIEPVADRLAAGKPACGTIALNAFHRGNRIFVSVHDDGRGLDANRIRDKALSKGIINEDDAQRLSDSETLQLIWEPGFSTAEKITEISGRGMGMDIVRSRIERINGVVDVNSQPGQGTTITMKLPLTMAIVPSLLTSIDGEVFAIPVESVAEIIEIRDDELSTINGRDVARVRDRVVPIASFGDLFHWQTLRTVDAQPHQRRRLLVIVESDGTELGLSVDRLIGGEDIVIKSVAENYRNVAGLAGASILGDGRVSLILDVNELMNRALRPR